MELHKWWNSNCYIWSRQSLMKCHFSRLPLLLLWVWVTMSCIVCSPSSSFHCLFVVPSGVVSGAYKQNKAVQSSTSIHKKQGVGGGLPLHDSIRFTQRTKSFKRSIPRSDMQEFICWSEIYKELVFKGGPRVLRLVQDFWSGPRFIDIFILFLCFVLLFLQWHSLQSFWNYIWLPISSGIPRFWSGILCINTILMVWLLSSEYCYVHTVFLLE